MDEKIQKDFAIGLIPARWNSTRFPGKPLHLIAGKPLVQHVWEKAIQCKSLSSLAIATDDARIEAAAKSFGAQVIMTSAKHPTGTDRLAEAAKAFSKARIIVNIQGDEPLLDPQLVDSLVLELKNDANLSIATAASPIRSQEDFLNPNVVKVVLAENSDALYFSRAPIPFARDPNTQTVPLRHHGIYAYRHDFLARFVGWPPSVLEKIEQLEQLRALEHGAKIRVLVTEHESIGVDTLEQAIEIENLLREKSCFTK